MDRYHDSARLLHGHDGALFRDLADACRPRVSARMARIKQREQRRQWIVVAGATSPTTSMWTSRAGWIEEVAYWAGTSSGSAVLTRVNLSRSMLLKVCVALAAHADHATGRHCAVTNAAAAKAAGCSQRSVTTVRAVLGEAGLAVEVRRGTGSMASPQRYRRPSVWHLVSRRRPVDNVAVCDLPPSRRDRRVTHVGKNSPKGRCRPASKNSPRSDTARQSEPRPLQLQLLAASVISRCRGFDAVHPGQICEVLTRSGLDLDVWTGAQIVDALNADMRRTGRTWPDSLPRPAGFLAVRLRGLPRVPMTSRRAQHGCTLAAVVGDVSAPASAKTRAEAMEYFRAHRRARIQR